MKNMKKISMLAVLVLTLTMFVSSTQIVSAQRLDSAIQLRGALCSNCNDGEMVTTYGSWGPWVVMREVKCSHYYYGTDLIYARNRTVTTRCNNCGMGSSSQQTETKTECHGYR